MIYKSEKQRKFLRGLKPEIVKEFEKKTLQLRQRLMGANKGKSPDPKD